ncbi:MAG TPA: hypothetical protein PLB73_18610, partial [Leptospiraceae bacterium]|nr:hypothetical protein [Leptospiraceae bacterium]
MIVPIEDLRREIPLAVEKNKTLSMVTYALSDYGEEVLKILVGSILEKAGRMDLFDIVYTAAKELVVNATKANLKRALFLKLSLNANDPAQYDVGMNYFRGALTEEKLRKYKKTFKEHNLPVVVTLYYSMDVVHIKVKNNFPLLDIEESRIRQKFRQATSFTSLLDFFMEHGDDTEGAGLGLTMVGILLDESGVDRHAFTLYSSEKYGETVARLEIPLSPDYVSKRKVFESEMHGKGQSPDQLRQD